VWSVPWRRAGPGHWADQGWGQRTSAAALLLLLLSWLPLALMHYGWVFLSSVLFCLDRGRAGDTRDESKHDLQCAGRFVESTGRLLHDVYAVGSGLGAIAATSAYALAGWHAVCALGAAVSLLALLFWRLTLPIEK